MAEKETQNFKNHTRLDPPYHFFLVWVALGNVIFAIYQLTQRQAFADVWFLITSLGFFVVVLRLRTYPLKVQDRLIRLEERLRLSIVLQEPSRRQIEDLTEHQLVALRFASDEELPELVKKALANQWSAKQIKAEIKNWRADHFRV